MIVQPRVAWLACECKLPLVVVCSRCGERVSVPVIGSVDALFTLAGVLLERHECCKPKGPSRE